jgi:hypothetical protein
MFSNYFGFSMDGRDVMFSWIADMAGGSAH